MKLVSIAEMRAIEQQADKTGLSNTDMMENAGRSLANEIQTLPYGGEDETIEALGLIGAGNNGGETLIALAHLAASGWRVRAYLLNRKADLFVERFVKAGGEIILAESDAKFEKLTALVGTTDVVVDGLLGIGLKLPLRAEVANLLNAVNNAIASQPWPPYVVAADCPSGVDNDTGEAAPETIPASMTLCMGAVKRGLLQFPAFELAGELRVADIGFGEKQKLWTELKHVVADDELVEDILPGRPADSHKGTFGTALIAAGSINYTGAALLAGKAAYRVGTGLVQMAVPGPVHTALAGHLPEATWVLLPQEMGVIAEPAAGVLLKNLERATALLVGPGLGSEDTTKGFVESLLSGKTSVKKPGGRIGFVQASTAASDETASTLPPLVIDADALRHLAKSEGWATRLPALAVLTPHPGEMAALTGLEKDEIQKDRQGTALKYAAEWGHVVVLKGAFTVIAAPDGRSATIPVATSALARAGTGDVLAGLIVGLRAQGVEAYEAAVAGAWVHAQAGLYAAERIGSEAAVMAGDVLDAIPEVLSGF